jgi:hypothetical protein
VARHLAERLLVRTLDRLAQHGAGTRPKESPEDEDDATADVHQCRVFVEGAGSGDLCPREGGIDPNIVGDLTP